MSRYVVLLAVAWALSACNPMPKANAFSEEGRLIYRENRCGVATMTQTTYSPRARSCQARDR